jgi:hypothetical protein
MGGRQLEWPGTPHLCEYRVGDVLPVVVPPHSSHGRLMRGCAFMDPLGIKAICRPGFLSG